MRPSPLCVALDSGTRSRLLEVVELTSPYAGMFKVGVTSFVRFGADFVTELARDKPVFLDLKLHDIPAQVAGATEAAGAAGASFVTVHAAGGSYMVAEAAKAPGRSLTVLAVTVLTSLGASELAASGVSGSLRDQTIRLAETALESGAGGLVCSALEVPALRARFGAEPWDSLSITSGRAHRVWGYGRKAMRR